VHRTAVTSQAAPLPTSGDEVAPARSALARRLPVLGTAVLALVAYLGWRTWDGTRPYEWSGTVEARTIDVGSRVGGRVKAVPAKEGDRIQAGQPLVELEVGDSLAQRLIAKGELDQASANLEKAKRGARPEEIEQANARAQTAVAALEETKVGARSEEIAGAAARLVAAQVAVDKAKLDADRARNLLSTQAISQAQFDDADIAYKSAIAQRDAAAQALDELKNGSRREDIAQAQARAAEARASARLVRAGSRVEDIEAAQAAVESAQGRLDQIDVMIGELVVRAPVAARVESLDLRPGDILAPNATAASLVEDDQLYVRIYVPETQIGHIHYGLEVPISVDSFQDRTFKGAVEYINKVGEYSPRNLQTADERANQVFATRVGIREGHDELRAGMAALIHVPK
jgi:HlyD family secretion protein